MSREIIGTFVASVRPKRKKRSVGLFLVLLSMGAFAYMAFASVARFFLGNAGVFVVTAVVVALLVPPYAHVLRQRKKSQRPAAFYRPLPQKGPGRDAANRLEAEILASFILGASAVIMLVVGTAARWTSGIGQYSDFPLEIVGLVLTWVAIAVIRAWVWKERTQYDPYDPDGPLWP